MRVKMLLQMFMESFELLELNTEWLPILKMNVKNNVHFMSTPFDEPSLNLWRISKLTLWVAL